MDGIANLPCRRSKWSPAVFRSAQRGFEAHGSGLPSVAGLLSGGGTARSGGFFRGFAGTWRGTCKRPSAPTGSLPRRWRRRCRPGGGAVFDRLFVGQAQNWYQTARGQSFRDFRIKITSDSPEIMAWPWEALYSREDGYLALRFPVERQLSTALGDPPPLPESLPQDALRILYVIPRPDGTGNVGYRTLAKSLVGCIEEENLPVTVDVLRPPTFDRLRQVLGNAPDITTSFTLTAMGATAIRPLGAGCYAAAEGRLAFENEEGRLEAIETTRLAQLLAQYRIPCMVLNACQSGMMDGQARDPFACVAAGLLRAGVYSVVAMGYSLYVSAAKEFVPAFYRKLFEKGSVSEAVRAGREEIPAAAAKLRHREAPLQDWSFRCCTGRCRRAMPASPASSRIARGRKGDRLCPRRRIWGTTASLGATGSFSSWSGPCSASPRRPS